MHCLVRALPFSLNLSSSDREQGLTLLSHGTLRPHVGVVRVVDRERDRGRMWDLRGAMFLFTLHIVYELVVVRLLIAPMSVRVDLQ